MKAIAALAAALGAAVVAGCAVHGAAPPEARVGAVLLLAQDPGGGRRYAGSAACGGCHQDASERWRATGHAADFAGLAGPERDNPACLRCHVTGPGDPLGYLSPGGVPGLANVGCEACHGPAADHAGSSHPELVPTATGGDCPPCEANRICRLCHTPAHSPGFDLARDLARVSCRGAARPDPRAH